MHLGIITDSERKTRRHRLCEQLCEAGVVPDASIQAWPWTDDAMRPAAGAQGGLPHLGELAILFLDVSAAFGYAITQHAIKNGVHVFLEQRSMPSLAEAKSLARLAEEAGVEVSVSRPLRTHPLVTEWSEDFGSELTLIRRIVAGQHNVHNALVEAVDLSCILAGMTNAQRVDAQVSRSDPRSVDMIAAALRFQNGSYAQIQLGQRAPTDEYFVDVFGHGARAAIDLNAGVSQISSQSISENAAKGAAFETKSIPAPNLNLVETQTFIEAIVNEKPAPASIVDAIRIQQIVEEIQKALR